MSSPSSRIATDAVGRRPRRRSIDRHDRAVLAAEVRRLANELYIRGPMPTDVLAQRCRAANWSEGTLDAAIREGVRQGRVRQLPLGYLDVPRGKPAADDAADAG